MVSFIKNVSYLYFSLHAEEVFTSNYLKDNSISGNPFDLKIKDAINNYETDRKPGL